MQNPKHILITGASSGIGAALAELYASPDTRLSLHGRNPDRMADIAAKARQKGAVVTTTLGDVTDTDSMAAWIHACEQQQPVDLVIANAGISPGLKTGQESMEQSRAVFATNLYGVLNTVQPVLPFMQKRGKGQIALMASIAGFYGFANAASYCSSKAAVRIYGEALRGDMAGYGVEINVICPGFIETPLTAGNPFPMPFLMSPERAARLIRSRLARNQGRIVFPWPMYALVKFVAALPQDFVGFLTKRLRKEST